jgi:hypothetical protein
MRPLTGLTALKRCWMKSVKNGTERGDDLGEVSGESAEDVDGEGN